MLTALCGPCCISSDYLFFWDWWDRDGIGGQYASEAEKLYFYSSWFLSFFFFSVFWTLPSIALYPAWMYVIKDGEVCLIDSDFSARNSLSPEWGLISRGKSNLLAILMSKTK